MAYKSFNVGDVVRLVLPENDMGDSPLKKFEGGEYVVIRVTTVKGGYVELEGVASDMGVPFSLLPDWLYRVSS